MKRPGKHRYPTAVEKIISGGQTGVDRGALDAAIARDVAHGGYCPKGRRAEDGTIPARYRLEETASADYAERTEKNILASDGTLVITRGRPTGGTALTVQTAFEHVRPCLWIDLDTMSVPEAVERIAQWLEGCRIRTLNVAGPRESTTRGIASAARDLVTSLLNPYGGRKRRNRIGDPRRGGEQ